MAPAPIIVQSELLKACLLSQGLEKLCDFTACYASKYAPFFTQVPEEPDMPSFDIVSEIDMHQLTNAVDQASRVIVTRFDFKGVDAGFEQDAHKVELHAEADFQLQQMVDMLRSALIKCEIDPLAMEVGDVSASGKLVKQSITMCHGLDKELAKKIVKLIKDEKLKVQSSIQGEQVRVTGKKRDDLQSAIALMKGKQPDVGQPLQYQNFRD